MTRPKGASFYVTFRLGRNVWRSNSCRRDITMNQLTRWITLSLIAVSVLTNYSQTQKPPSTIERFLNDAVGGSAIRFEMNGFTGNSFEYTVSENHAKISGTKIVPEEGKINRYSVSIPYELSKETSDSLSSFLSKSKVIDYLGEECEKRKQ